MPPRHLWIAVPIALVAWTLAAGEAPVLRPGETVRLEMPAGDPEKTSVTLQLVATEDGPLTVETSTLYFDTLLRVFDGDAAADAKPLAEDDDGGVGGGGANSQLTFEAAGGRSYRVEVRGSGDERGGPFEVSGARGAPPTLDAGERQKRDAAYWDAVAAEGARVGSENLESRGLTGRGTLLYAMGEYSAARPLFERALAIVERVHGPENPDTARTLNNLAGLLQTMGEYVAARPLLERALAINEKVHGPEHPDTATSLNSLARLLQAMGEYASARPLYERALAIYEKHGPEHPNTATSLNDLASLLRAMGEYAAARPLYERALAIYEKVHGPEHPYTATGLNNLAGLLQAMGEYASARPLYERALAIREKVNGPEHSNTATGLNNLARLLQAMGEYAAARPLFERALAIYEKVHGPEHPYTATSLNNLARLLQATGEYAAARPLYERALAIREKVHGPEHPNTATSLGSLARLLQAMGEYAAARPLFERALAIYEKAHGPEHPNTATGLNSLAYLLQAMGEYAAARPLFERALAIYEKAHGPEHPDTASGLNNLAYLLQAMGEYAAARPLFERALAIFEEVHGPEHPDTASSLSNLANLLQTMGEYAAARPLFERALAIDEKAHGPEHPDTASSLNNLANLLQATGEYAAARLLFERALAIKEKVNGPEHRDTAAGLNNLARLLQDMGEYAAARPLHERALAIFGKVLGPEHPETATGLDNLAGLLQATGEYASARPLFERALAIRQKVLGPDHPDVALSLNSLARLRATQGEIAAALDQALDAERIGREHLQVTGRSLSEREALRYAAVRRSGLDLALTVATLGLEPDQRRRTLDALVRSRAVILDEMAARHRAIGGSLDPEVARLADHLASRRARLAALAVRGPGNQKPEIYRKLLDDARKEKENAERALAASSARFARELSRGRLGLDEVAASLPEGSALVAFGQYKRIDLRPKSPAATGSNNDTSSYLAFVLRAGARNPEVVDLGRAGGIDDAVSRWKKEASRGVLLAGDPMRAEAAYREAGATLRGKVWDPLAAAIGEATRVFVVPDGSLNLVSVAALPVADVGYLIERGPLVHYVSAERDLVPAGKERSGAGLLALGGPSYDATAMFAALRHTATSDAPMLLASAATYRGQHSACRDFATVRFEPLPATAKETREIVRLWESATGGESGPADVLDLREAAASETALKHEAAGRRVLHLATHGFFLGGECESALASARGIGGLAEESAGKAPSPVTGENPLLLSGLALAGANHRSAAGEGEEDGILTAEEIASLDLSGVEWAVLSACETGLGDVRAGEGVFGLRRAFQVAGAGTLIMSLWSVEDEATRQWMKALYEGRLAKGLDTAEAVRQASLTLMKQRRKAGLSTHPFYWAAFVAAGDWR